MIYKTESHLNTFFKTTSTSKTDPLADVELRLL